MTNPNLEESMKTTNLLWIFCLIVLEICTIIPVGMKNLSIELPDFIIRGIGLMDLAVLLILRYTTVKKLKDFIKISIYKKR